ncbi:MAG TPA: MaoC family dehydratase [Candidatus Limnocylindria bacterium]|nr:MaoC family dehydratase [Candidatus Limnocylindria bacterium]
MSVKRGWEGRYFDDFAVGDVYRSRIGRTISEADNTQFTLLTNNTNQIHFNEHYAKGTEFGRTLVNSAFTLSVVAGLAVVDTSENGFALGWDEVTLPSPLFAGDTLYAESEVLEARTSRSRPGWGIVKVRQRGIKQDGTVVLVMTRSFMVPSRAVALARDHFPGPKG